MKKLAIRSSIFFVFFTSIILTTYGQVSVKKVESINDVNSSTGFFYSLPQTVFKVVIVFEKVQSLKGPLASFSSEYIGVTDYISNNNIEYNLVDVQIEMQSEPDPNQLYFVQLPAERVKDATTNTFTLSEIGSLTAYNAVPTSQAVSEEVINENTIIFTEGDMDFPYMSQYNKRKKTDTIVRSINIDTLVINRFLFKSSWIDKSANDKAKDAAIQIENIRESRYNLISGYQEVNYGSSIVYMDHQLQKMEDQYMELFLGKTIKTLETKTVYFIPNKNNSSIEIMKFSDGKSVIARTDSEVNSDIGEAPKSTVNNIYYRIPASAEVSITSGNINFFSHRYIINQLGSVVIAPLDNSNMVFDANTGNITKIIR